MCIINKLKLPREGMQLGNPNRKWWALIGVSLLGFIGFIDFTIVNTALPSIQKDLSAAALCCFYFVYRGCFYTSSSSHEKNKRLKLKKKPK